MDLPAVPRDRLDGWRRVAKTTDRPFTAGPVSVTASTVRFERTEAPAPRPFCFASRLRVRPQTPPNAALTRLVERQARAGFSDRLAERHIENVEHRSDRGIAIDDPDASRATLSTFRGVCNREAYEADRERAASSSDAETIPVEALLAVWEAGEYLLGGGAYSIAGEAADARRELLGIIRGVRPPDGQNDAR